MALVAEYEPNLAGVEDGGVEAEGFVRDDEDGVVRPPTVSVHKPTLEIKIK